MSKPEAAEENMKCRICGEEFTPARKHPGYINVCLEEDCRANARSFDAPVTKPPMKVKHAGQNDGDIPDWMSDMLYQDHIQNF